MKTYMNNIKIDFLYFFHSKIILLPIMLALIFSLLQASNLNQQANEQITFYEKCYEEAEIMGLEPDYLQFKESGIEEFLLDENLNFDPEVRGENVAGAYQLAQADVFMIMPRTFVETFFNQNGLGILVALIAMIAGYCFGNDYDNKIIKVRAITCKSYHLLISKYISSIIIIITSMMLVFITTYLVSLINYMNFDVRGLSIHTGLFENFQYNIWNSFLLVTFNTIVIATILQLFIILLKKRLIPMFAIMAYALMQPLFIYDIKVLMIDLFAKNQAYKSYSGIKDYSISELYLILTSFIILLYIIGVCVFNKQSKYIS